MRGGIDLEAHRFRTRLLELMYRRISDPEVGPYLLREALALRTPGWGVYTVPSGIDPGEHRFGPHFFRVVDVPKDF